MQLQVLRKVSLETREKGGGLHSPDFQGQNEYPRLLQTHTSHPAKPRPSPSDVSSSSSISPFLTQIACQKRPSGFLVSVLSGAEASFLASLVKVNLNTHSNIWIGIHDPTQVREYLLSVISLACYPGLLPVPRACPRNTLENPRAQRSGAISGEKGGP